MFCRTALRRFRRVYRQSAQKNSAVALPTALKIYPVVPCRLFFGVSRGFRRPQTTPRPSRRSCSRLCGRNPPLSRAHDPADGDNLPRLDGHNPTDGDNLLHIDGHNPAAGSKPSHPARFDLPERNKTCSYFVAFDGWCRKWFRSISTNAEVLQMLRLPYSRAAFVIL